MYSNLIRLYFNLVYNPLYDITTALFPFYARLQEACLSKMDFESCDSVLCVGTGTGQELPRILGMNSDIRVWGIDASGTALKKAESKTRNDSARIRLLKMDAHHLDFSDGTFHKAVCMHVMGFLSDDSMATAEILRVLRSGGQFVLTYPSGNGNPDLVKETWRDARKKFSCGHRQEALRELFALALGGLVYLPCFFGARPRHGFYSKQSLDALFATLPVADYEIEEDRSYEDLIVYGKKR